MKNIKEVLVSGEIVDEYFCCNLNKCKGICCVEGDYGAPLDEKEIIEIQKAYKYIEKYLSKKSILEIKKQGFFVKDIEGDFVTPIFKGKGRCVYLFEDGDIYKCSFEKAYSKGEIKWKKPISCHLYPIRITKLSNNTEAVNYHKWDICYSACELGINLKLPLFKFLKEPLVRKYGEEWYNELEKSI